MFNKAALQKSIFMAKPPNVSLVETDSKNSLSMLSQKYYGTECTTEADSWTMSHILAGPANHRVSLLWTLWTEAYMNIAEWKINLLTQALMTMKRSQSIINKLEWGYEKYIIQD